MKKLLFALLVSFPVISLAQQEVPKIFLGIDEGGQFAAPARQDVFTRSADANKLLSGWLDIATEPNSGRMDNVVVAYNNLVWSIMGYGFENSVRFYDPASDTWTVVPDSQFPQGNNYARSGANHGSKVFVYGDATTSGFTGLWSYDMNTSTWTQETPSGTPPAPTGIWAPAWVRDPDTGLLYITGGATTPGGGNLATVYVYNPSTNTWEEPLPNFTTVRNFHAAYIFNHPTTGNKMLMVAGGNSGGNAISSTQCYDFTTGLWNLENADAPVLPEARWGMGYTHASGSGNHHLWLVGGNGTISIMDGSTFLDLESMTWEDGGTYHTSPVYRTSATSLHGTVYKLGGSTGGFSFTGLASKLEDFEYQEPVSVPLTRWTMPGIFMLMLAFTAFRFRPFR